MSKRKKFLLYVTVFFAAYFVPFKSSAIQGAVVESFLMLQEYAREHVLFCLIPAFFIAGAIANFISQQAVIKYFGSQAKKWVSYTVASVSGAILAVCSCTVLPLFAGIYKRGAGIGPATAFLYSGPAINVLAIILTGRVLGWQLGLARAVGAVVFALVIGLLMAVIFRKEDKKRLEGKVGGNSGDEGAGRTGFQNLIYFVTLVLILIFAAWARPEQSGGFWMAVFKIKWPITITLLVILGIVLKKWFDKNELTDWVDSTWDFAAQILPLLFAGVLVAGFLMGRPGAEAGIIPAEWVSRFVGGNSLTANLTASVLGAFMYFATLTEIPILQGLMGLGMGKGPALTLLLAGPALSLPNMLVIRSVLGTKKTLVFVGLVIVMATLSGMIYGIFVV
ncbi:MAG: permease [Halanaerobiales bacterium]